MASALEKDKKTRCGVFLEVVTTSTGLAAIQHPQRVTGRGGPNRLGCHILERERGKPFLLGDRAGTGLRGREMGRPSRDGSIRVAQHQPDGVRLLPGRARGLRETHGRLSVTGPRGLQRSLSGVGLDLRLMNRGSTSTCVAWRGESIVHLTWASPVASRRVSGWGVSPEETLSDHLYILMEVAVRGAMGDPSLDASGPTGPPGRRRGFPRWAATHRDQDFMAAAAIAVAWSEESPTDEDAEAGATRLRRDLHAICDSCIPRSGIREEAGVGRASGQPRRRPLGAPL